VTVTSHLKEVDRNRLLFEVECRKGEVLLGTGTHRRAVIPALREPE
jgi:predicted thioesterase